MALLARRRRVGVQHAGDGRGARGDRRGDQRADLRIVALEQLVTDLGRDQDHAPSLTPLASPYASPNGGARHRRSVADTMPDALAGDPYHATTFDNVSTEEVRLPFDLPRLGDSSGPPPEQSHAEVSPRPSWRSPPGPQGPLAGPDGLLRRPWGLSAPDYVAYHDAEWGRPVHGDQADLRAALP